MSKGFVDILTKIHNSVRRVDDATMELMSYHLTDEQLGAIMDASYQLDQARSSLQRRAQQRNDRWHEYQDGEEVSE